MDFKKVLAAVDRATTIESPKFQRALRLAEKENAKLMILHCLPQETIAEMEGRIATLAEVERSEPLYKVGHEKGREIEHIRAWLEELCRVAQEKGIEAIPEIAAGKPGPTVVNMAEHWEADVIVLGQTKRSALSDFLVRGTSSYVTYHSPCSILFVHEGVLPEQ
ncbi:MAG: universal stress protein [Desulfoferrobacter sp.]